MANPNLEYWLYDTKSVTPWYFWPPPKQNSIDKLRSLWVVDAKPEVKEESSLLKQIKKNTLWEESDNTTLMSRLQESWEKRLQQSQNIDASDRNWFRKLLDRTALKAGSFRDIIWAWIWEAFETSGQLLSAITPDSIEDGVKNEVIRQFEMVTQSQLWQIQGNIAKWIGYTAKEVYDLLPENVQQDVESLWTIWLWILDAIGVGYAAKWAKSATSQGLKQAWEVTKDTLGNVIPNIKTGISKWAQTVSNILPWKPSSFAESIAGIDEKTKNILKEVSTETFDSYVDSGRKAAQNIKNPTPLAIAWDKALDTLNRS
mgnify:FL=1